MKAFHPAHGFDKWVATLSIFLLAPVLLLRAIVGFLRTGAVLEKSEIKHGCKSFSLIRFSGFSRGRKLGFLFNVAAGDLVFVGEGVLIEEAVVNQRDPNALETYNEKAPPCLINLDKLRKRSGTKYDDYQITNLSVMDKLGILSRYVLINIMVPKQSYYRPKQFQMLGVPIDNLTLESATGLVINHALEGKRCRLAFVNADCLNIAVKNKRYQGELSKMSHVFADGIGLQIGAQMLGVELQGNVNGTDLLPKICEQSIQNQLSIYLLGGKPGVAQEAASSLQDDHPGLTIVGAQHGYFAAEDTDDVISSINNSGADILLVAFGAPLQEIWINTHHEKLTPTVQMGVGGLFDFHTQRISRSPRWVQDVGMEWIWRFKQEPLRLWRRYLVGNPLFLYRVHKQVNSDRNCANYRRFKDPYKIGSTANKRYRRKQYLWLLKLQLARIGKRLIDLMGSTVALLALSPVLLIVALLIKLESKGPVLFHQKRVGRYGETFSMLKFRSMRTDAESVKSKLSESNEVAGGVTFKMKSDPRVTKIGKYIRRYSIDELPQLINVIRGDMSLVGPRPPVPSEVDLYTGRDRRRLEVIPGITGLWQVSGRSDTTFEEQVDLDIDYLESRGFVQDVLIMLKTVPAVFSGRGAY